MCTLNSTICTLVHIENDKIDKKITYLVNIIVLVLDTTWSLKLFYLNVESLRVRLVSWVLRSMHLELICKQSASSFFSCFP